MATLDQVSNGHLTQSLIQTVGEFRILGPFTNTPASWRVGGWEDAEDSWNYYRFIPVNSNVLSAAADLFAVNDPDNNERIQPGDFIDIRLRTTYRFQYIAQGFPIQTINPRTFTYGNQGGPTAEDGRPVYLGRVGAASFFVGIQDRPDLPAGSLETFSAREMNFPENAQRYSMIGDPGNLYINSECTFLTGLDTSSGDVFLTIDPDDSNKIVVGSPGDAPVQDTYPTILAAGLTSTAGPSGGVSQTFEDQQFIAFDDDLFVMAPQGDVRVNITLNQDALAQPLQVETTQNVDNIQFGNEFSVTPQGTQVNVQYTGGSQVTVGEQGLTAITTNLDTLTFDADDFNLTAGTGEEVIIQSVARSIAVEGHTTSGDNTQISTAVAEFDFNNDDFILSSPDSGDTVSISLRGGTAGTSGIEVREDSSIVANSATQIRFTDGLDVTSFDMSGVALNPQDSQTNQDDLSYLEIRLESNIPRVESEDFTATEIGSTGVYSHTFNHMLGNPTPIVQVWDNETPRQMVIPMQVIQGSSPNEATQTTITFPSAVSGTITVMG